jgi:Tetracyclin repressor-like, C-terminal domain
VDTKLVRYYFAGKAELLEECLVAPDGLLKRARALAGLPIGERGEAIVRTHLAAWADPDMARVMRTSLLIAAHEPAAMTKVRAVFADGLIPAIGDGLDPAELNTRGAFARFIFAVDQTAAIPDDQIVRSVGATVQRYLSGPL